MLDDEHPLGSPAHGPAGGLCWQKQAVKCPELWDGAVPGRVGSHIALFTLAAHDILPLFLMEDSIFLQEGWAHLFKWKKGKKIKGSSSAY